MRWVNGRNVLDLHQLAAFDGSASPKFFSNSLYWNLIVR